MGKDKEVDQAQRTEPTKVTAKHISLEDMIRDINKVRRTQNNPVGYILKYDGKQPKLFVVPWALHNTELVTEGRAPVAYGREAVLATLERNK